MWGLDREEGWVPKNWCFWTVVLGKTFEGPLDCKEIKPVNPKGNQPWIFIGRTDGEAEAIVLWPPDVKSWLMRVWKDPDAGRIEGKRRRGWRGWHGWHHRLSGHESEQFWEVVKDREAWCAAIHGVAKSWTRLRAWTTTTFIHNGILLNHKK